ncbi:hypothetical protein OOZ19_03200 [Saccharopolyspora sp. NFXS83]|uniref:hypothetical protein n=1 Tax=Saccharopolyspora sp. NFXS83 TaxID=2993560 RepID=UPI00224ADF4E|nr:hypothetical protein [Saccharopolyspora sp. NFXS83]MCX2729234.1 hypothetical protein [Saccharopolyspora sp. NFXS83]
MATLTIHSVICHETSDGFGSDDLFINFRGERVFGVQQIDEGQTINPGTVSNFSVKGLVDFWERDSGSDNDYLGGFWVHRNQVGQGELNAQLSGDDSNYAVNYEITA